MESTHVGGRQVVQAIVSESGRLDAAARRGGSLALWLPIAGLVLFHSIVPYIVGSMAPIVSLACVVVLALSGAKACLARARISGASGWLMLAMAKVIWAGGMMANAAVHLSLGHYQGDASLCLLFFVLYGVPLVFATSSPETERLSVRVLDGLIATALGVLFFVHTFGLATMAGASAADAELLTRMFDIENGLIALFALFRFTTSHTRANRDFFGSLAAYGFVYLLTTAYMDHWQKDTDYGTSFDLIIDLPMLFLIALTQRSTRKPSRKTVDASQRERLAQAISPLLLPAMLLVVAATMLGSHPRWAVAGFATATIVYGLRNALTHLRNLEERDRLAQLSQIDDLTGLPNRRSFDAALHSEWARAARSGTSLCVLMIDIDHFKLLNDHLGHQEGDRRLRDVAEALAGCASRAADMVARYGGEEFVVILPGASAEEARTLAETMRIAVLALALATPAPGGRVSISIGVSATTMPAIDTPDALLACADAALYAAKRDGRNTVHMAMAA
ncbi:GGDEF domain-containing protein [Novosphingobium rosa]|uniref:GGDEF domain-containing protein n=1 Tax=Novosphingobium rosa TaxID=76978 RepID=UPI000836C586|nr:diguanylate cyclase [Novosphingobium rosa]